jgi:sarcosine oxidase/L-pipecolate oxidase
MQHMFSNDQHPVWLSDIARTGFYGFPATSDGIVKIGIHGDGYINPVRLADGRECSGLWFVMEESCHDTAVPVWTAAPTEAVDSLIEFVKLRFPMLRNELIMTSRLCWYCDSWDSNFFIDHVPGELYSSFMISLKRTPWSCGCMWWQWARI